LALRGKDAFNKGWQKTPATEADFVDGINLGLATGKGYVDVDLDWPMASKIADQLLHTLPAHGRKSSAHSHRWARCDDAKKRVTFELPSTVNHPNLPKQHTLCVLELRGVDHQTMIPPSVH